MLAFRPTGRTMVGMAARRDWDIPFTIFVAIALWIGVWKHETIRNWVSEFLTGIEKSTVPKHAH